MCMSRATGFMAEQATCWTKRPASCGWRASRALPSDQCLKAPALDHTASGGGCMASSCFRHLRSDARVRPAEMLVVAATRFLPEGDVRIPERSLCPVARADESHAFQTTDPLAERQVTTSSAAPKMSQMH